jgi:hypothetical protein
MKMNKMQFLEADGAPSGNPAPATTDAPASGGASLLGGDPTPPTQTPTQSPYFGPDGSFAEGWMDRLPEDFLKPEEVDSFKSINGRYKSPLEIAKANFHKDKLLSKRGVVIPNENSTPEEVSAYRKAVGVPDSADKYNVKPEKLPEGLEWSDDLAKPILDIAHKHGIPEAAMKELVAAHMANEAQRTGAVSEMIEKDLETGRQELQKSFGQDFEKKIDLAKRAAQSVGVNPLSRGFMDPDVVKGFVRLAEKISEDRLTGDGKTGGLMGGEALAKAIQTDANHPLHAKYLAGDPDTIEYLRSLRVNG